MRENVAGAVDKHGMQRLVGGYRRRHRRHRRALTGVTRGATAGRVRDLLPMFDARLPVETVIRRLQARPRTRLLAELLPPVQNFEALLRRQSREEQVSGLLMTRSISLPTDNARFGVRRSENAGYQARKMWINHLRQVVLPG